MRENTDMVTDGWSIDDVVATFENPPPYIGDEAFAAFLKKHGCQTDLHCFRSCYYGAAICPWREDTNDALGLAERLSLHQPEDLHGTPLIEFLQTLFSLFRHVDAEAQERPFALSPADTGQSRDELVDLTYRRVEEIYLGVLEGVWQSDRALSLTAAEAALLTAIELASDRYDRLGLDLNRGDSALDAETVAATLREIAALDEQVTESVNALAASFRENPSAERRDMTRSSALIESLAHSEEFPADAVRECLDRREEMVPVLLQLLSDQVKGRGLLDDQGDALFLGVHILGELREQSAFAALLDLLAKDGYELDRLFGDALTETLPKVLISTYDGDTARLCALIENAQADEFARDTAFKCWTYYVAAGRIDRAEAERYLSAALKTLQPREYCYAWTAWLYAIALLGFTGLKGVVRNAYDLEYVYPGDIGYSSFERLVDKAADTDDPLGFLADEGLVPFDDTIGTISKWHAYSEEAIRQRKERDQQIESEWTDYTPIEPITPTVNPMRNVGRNDPCPCGSGKKYKKCCLR